MKRSFLKQTSNDRSITPTKKSDVRPITKVNNSPNKKNKVEESKSQPRKDKPIVIHPAAQYQKSLMQTRYGGMSNVPAVTTKNTANKKFEFISNNKSRDRSTSNNKNTSA